MAVVTNRMCKLQVFSGTLRMGLCCSETETTSRGRCKSLEIREQQTKEERDGKKKLNLGRILDFRASC